MADTTAGSGSLTLDNDAFNYFVEDRLSHISAQQDAIYISYFYPSGLLGPHDSVYLVIYIDRKQDGRLDAEDYEFVGDQPLDGPANRPPPHTGLIMMLLPTEGCPADNNVMINRARSPRRRRRSR